MTELSYEPKVLIVAGYTARSAEDRLRHIDELRSIGIPAPPRVPMFWHISSSLLTTAESIQVQGSQTSGEVEYALLFSGHGVFVAVASDHTDRQMEASSLPRSKQLCPKVIGREVFPLEELTSEWDSMRLVSDIKLRNGGWQQYQRELVTTVLAPEPLVAACFGDATPPDGTVLLSGTVPLVDGKTRFAQAFRGRLELPGASGSINLEYAIDRLPEFADESGGEAAT